MAKIDGAWFDATPKQVLGFDAEDITPDTLRTAGFNYISGDCDSVEGACIWVWKRPRQNRWYVALFSGEERVASALVYSSLALADVIRDFTVIGGVI